MTAVLYTNHFVQFFDNNGDPLSNGKLFAYSAGTTTPKATYTTEAATVENSHPIVLDAAGRATVFIQGSYRFDLFDENDVLIKSTDDVTSFTTLNEAGDPFFQSFSGTGSQTVFTLSESLGSDSKDIMVYVNNESGDVGYDIQNPSAYTLSETTLTFNSAPPSGTDNIYVFAPTKLLGAASASAAAAAASEAAAAAAQTAAESAQADAESAAGLVTITSTTSLAIGTGSKTFTVASGLSLNAGQFILATSDADADNYMWGTIASYSGTTLIIDVVTTGGSGTLNDWTLRLTGERGVQGPTGTLSATSGVTAATSAGASLISSGGNTCLSWGGGGGANTSLGGNMSGGGSHKLVNMADGTSAQDYVTKAQLDSLNITVADASTAGNIVFNEDTDNGTNGITLSAPASVTSDRTITLPDEDGTVALTSDLPASGIIPISIGVIDGTGTASVTTIAGQTLSITDNGVGNYTITVAGAASITLVQATAGRQISAGRPTNNSATIVSVGEISGNTIDIRSYASAASALDGDLDEIYITIYGTLS